MKRALIAVVLVLTACASAATRPSSDSGVDGIVLLGPQCPVVQKGKPCPDKPAGVELRARDTSDGNVAATFSSDKKTGKFHVALAPGDYTIELVRKNGPPSGGPVPVRVTAHRFASITFKLDSGIR